MGTLILRKEARIYNGAKTASSVTGPGKTGQLPTTIHKDKMDPSFTCKTRNYKTLRGKRRTLDDIFKARSSMTHLLV